jgi:hypothetical protein
VRSMRTGEREPRAQVGKFLGFFSTRRKAGSLHGSSQIRPIYHRGKIGRGVTLVDPDRLQLRGPFERQIDPVEQRLGVELSRRTSLADRFDDARCSECQT